FRNPEAGEFRDSEVGFFLSADAPAIVRSHRPAEWDPRRPVQISRCLSRQPGVYHHGTALPQSA
ncbi:hypothetical protein ACCS48_26565, partial [Rhizobium brockwellii]|uniref:hypothetical protein n=1 Tax=Rhizobium brockwellii TaxID=3019932 RepID=UPI003F9A670C